MAGPNKLRMLLEENDEVFKAGRRSPEQGWRYLKYLAPMTLKTSRNSLQCSYNT